ncbi:class I SAM-dependent methyltransferase [Streptomyces sclerotialus]|uniref:class I SAM-dependent methyltransferase n=1 Tax=Streptomyces sclerotialus TaxID=1957 RepID=UPI000A5F207D
MSVEKTMDHDQSVRHALANLLRESPIDATDLVDTLALYLRRRPLVDVLAMDALYRMAYEVPGAMMEFGVLQGRHLALLSELRDIYEPHNVHREIIGFDTFEGFQGAVDIDGGGPAGTPEKFGLPPSFPDHLQAALAARNGDGSGKSPVRLVRGDASTTVKEYLAAHEHTVVAMAYFDLDLYVPTKEVLTALVPYLTKGSILAFDEVAHEGWPGETAALRDSLGLDRGAVRFVLPGRAKTTYLRWEG